MKQSNICWIAFFRISVSFYAIIALLSMWKDIPKILYEGAYIKPELLDAIMDTYTPTLYDMHIFLGKYFTMNFDSLVNSVLIIQLISLVFLLGGLFTRSFAIIALLAQLIIAKSMHFYLYGADFFLSMALFYCVIFPKSKFSLDYYFFKFQQNPISIKWSLLLLQIHLSIIYFFSGLDKGLGINWYNGESIWRAIAGHNYNGLIDLTALSIPPYVFATIGIITLVVEFFYPFFVFQKESRKLWTNLTIGMHLSIAIFMGLYLFALLMIILNLSAFYVPYLNNDVKEFSLIKFAKSNKWKFPKIVK